MLTTCQVNAYNAMMKVPQGLAEIAKQLENANRLKAIELSMEMCKTGDRFTRPEDFDFISSLRTGNGML